MADTNVQLPSLSAAVSATDADLMLIRQGSQDKKLVLSILKDYILNGGDFTAAEILALLLTVDGSGSGLDADLLDGQHGSFYQNASNLNAGTVPNARLNAANLLALLLTVDGPSSGLNADLLDNQHGSFYQNASNLNAGTVPEARLTSASTGAKGIIEIATQTEVNNGTAGSLAVTSATLKNEYTETANSTGGRIKLPSFLGGYELKWGQWTATGNTVTAVNFPTSFSSVIYQAVGVIGFDGGNDDKGLFIFNPTTSGFSSRLTGSASGTCRYFAIGK